MILEISIHDLAPNINPRTNHKGTKAIQNYDNL